MFGYLNTLLLRQKFELLDQVTKGGEIWILTLVRKYVHQKSEMTEKQYLFVCFFRTVVVVCCLNWYKKLLDYSLFENENNYY